METIIVEDCGGCPPDLVAVGMASQRVETWTNRDGQMFGPAAFYGRAPLTPEMIASFGGWRCLPP